MADPSSTALTQLFAPLSNQTSDSTRHLSDQKPANARATRKHKQEQHAHLLRERRAAAAGRLPPRARPPPRASDAAHCASSTPGAPPFAASAWRSALLMFVDSSTVLFRWRRAALRVWAVARKRAICRESQSDAELPALKSNEMVQQIGCREVYQGYLNTPVSCNGKRASAAHVFACFFVFVFAQI